ncbi:MAG: hypothetical protein AB7Q29_18845 [Vicinamibacterales bacterium]
MAHTDNILLEIETIRLAAAKLPVCDGAARLHALLGRVIAAVEKGESPQPGADELVQAAAAALEGDPWTQFERAARALHTAVVMNAPSSTV